MCIHIYIYPFLARFHEIFATEWRKQFRYDLPSAGQEIEEAGYSCKTDGFAMGSRMAGLFSLTYSRFFSSLFFYPPLFFPSVSFQLPTEYMYDGTRPVVDFLPGGKGRVRGLPKGAH